MVYMVICGKLHCLNMAMTHDGDLQNRRACVTLQIMVVSSKTKMPAMFLFIVRVVKNVTPSKCRYC